MTGGEAVLVTRWPSRNLIKRLLALDPHLHLVKLIIWLELLGERLRINWVKVKP